MPILFKFLGGGNLQFAIKDIKNSFESMIIKKNNLGNFVLYGLLWCEYEKNSEKIKSLTSIKSENLVWNYNMEILYSPTYEFGYSDNVFIEPMIRNFLHNFSFTNIFDRDKVFVTFQTLNKGDEGFMNYNIYENLDNYIVQVDMAGVKKNEIRVTLEDNIIKIKANPKKQNDEDLETKVEMFKPVKGEVEIFLPVESVEAKFEDGILILTAPKVSKGVNIEIK